MKKAIQLVALSAVFLAIGIFVGYRIAANSKPSWLVATAPAVKSSELNPVDTYIDECLSNRSLLDMASGHAYEASTEQEKLDLVQEWCQNNARQGFESLSPDDRSFSIRRLRTQLDNLLSEKEFEPKE